IIDSLQDEQAVNRRINTIENFNLSKTEGWKRIESNIKPDALKYYNLKRVLKVAAVLLIGVFIGYLTLNSRFIEKDNSIATVNSDSVLLEFNQGQLKALSTSGIMSLTSPEGETIAIRQGDFLKYKRISTNNSPEIVYHKLEVPYGKTFKIELSDFTLVHLNSGSSLRYPMQFKENRNRLVTLIGEAYFEVSKDTSRPVVVQTDEINVRVLGTRFVMNSFNDAAVTRTVLIEGSVALYKSETNYNANTTAVLSPGQMGELNKDEDQITVKEVDTQIYMDWLGGKLIFHHKPFPEILKSLERHFNIKIENMNKHLGEQVFTATFESESIDE